MARNWTPEERRKQAEAIRRWQPWKHSTGPKTPEGKAAMPANALKHGFRSREFRELRAVLHRQKSCIKTILQQSKDFEPKTAAFENRLAEYESVFEKRKRRKARFAGQKPQIASPSHGGKRCL